MNNKPADTIRDGSMKATIWANDTEKGTFYTVDFTRSYKKGDDWQETNKGFSTHDLFKVMNLSQIAYNRIVELRAQSNQTDPQTAAEDYSAATGTHENAYEIPV